MYYVQLKEKIISLLVHYSKEEILTENAVLLIEGDTGAAPKLIKRMLEILILKGYILDSDGRLHFVKKGGINDDKLES